MVCLIHIEDDITKKDKKKSHSSLSFPHVVSGNNLGLFLYYQPSQR